MQVVVPESASGPLLLTMARGASIDGRVTGESGQPVTGALVRLLALAVARDSGRRREAAWNSPTSTVTDAAGRYRFCGLPPVGGYIVEVDHRRYARVRIEGWASDADSVDAVDFRLKRASTIRGRVVDETGRGVPAARVKASFLLPAAHLERTRRTGTAGGATRPRRMETAHTERVRTDRFGRYEIEGVAPDTYTVQATASGRFVSSERAGVTIVPAQATVTVDLMLERGVRVSGSVVDAAGKPLVGVELRFLGRGMPRVLSDRRGRFTATALPTGPVSVRLRKSGYTTVIPTVTAPSRDVRFEMQPLPGGATAPSGITGSQSR